MAIRIKANKDGDIIIPHGAFDSLSPEADYEVEMEGNVLRVARVDSEPVPTYMKSPEERVRAFLEWVDEPKPSVPHIPDEALRRENLYD